MEIKRHWLGNCWYLPGAAGNDINKVHDFSLFDSPVYKQCSLRSMQTNVPDIRLAYRHQTLLDELNMIRGEA